MGHKRPVASLNVYQLLQSGLKLKIFVAAIVQLEAEDESGSSHLTNQPSPDSEVSPTEVYIVRMRRTSGAK